MTPDETIENGGPAFPVGKEAAISPVTDIFGADISSGMSLRDWFAGQAVSGICAHPDTWGLLSPEMAMKSYQIADAMLSARKIGGAA